MVYNSGAPMAKSELNKKDDDLIFDKITKLEEYANELGMTIEAQELIENLESTLWKIKLKNFELALIETLAMTSNDKNIIDLRNQLFATTKLIHNNELEMLLNDHGILNAFFNNEHQNLLSVDSSRIVYDETKLSIKKRNNIIKKLINFFIKRKNLNKVLKELKNKEENKR